MEVMEGRKPSESLPLYDLYTPHRYQSKLSYTNRYCVSYIPPSMEFSGELGLSSDVVSTSPLRCVFVTCVYACMRVCVHVCVCVHVRV